MRLGAGLMRALGELTGGEVRFAGIGGEQMRREGLDSLFPISELAVMGVFELLPHVPRLLGRVRETVADVAARQPVALVTIDSKAFTLRVAGRLRRQGTRVPAHPHGGADGVGVAAWPGAGDRAHPGSPAGAVPVRARLL